MLQYRLTGENERIHDASDFILKHLQENSVVLEIGCGIGIITERIARKLKQEIVYACDISSQNIWHCESTIHQKNIHFFTCDVLEDFCVIEKTVNQSVDVFVFADVIEHIPIESHYLLFKRLKNLASLSSIFILTFPCEFLQDYYAGYHPEKLQNIDERFTYDHIKHLACAIKFIVKHFEYKDIWHRADYVHCILCSQDILLQPIQPPAQQRGLVLWKEILSKIQYRYRRWKYVDRIFQK